MKFIQFCRASNCDAIPRPLTPNHSSFILHLAHMSNFVRLFLVLLLALQSVAYAGPVCGNHITTKESMDCCEKGHDQTEGAAAADSHSEECCSTCDLGKTNGIKLQKADPMITSAISSDFPLLIAAPISHPDWDPQRFHSYSPPELFLLNESFRI